MVTFGCFCWNSWMALIVRSWRSCEPHQANRSATGSPLLAAGWPAAAGAAVADGWPAAGAAGAVVAAGAEEEGAPQAATMNGNTRSRWSQAGNGEDNRRIAASAGTESVFNPIL